MFNRKKYYERCDICGKDDNVMLAQKRLLGGEMSKEYFCSDCWDKVV